ncbi:hypothetical protein V8E53_001599 [Lactarius tabidus]
MRRFTFTRSPARLQDLWSNVARSYSLASSPLPPIYFNISSFLTIPSNIFLVLGQLQTERAPLCLHFSKNHSRKLKNMSHAQTLKWDATGPTNAMREKRHTCPIARVHRPIVGSFIHRPRTSFSAAAICSSTYHCVVVLDWTRPWTFLEELHAWLERRVQGNGACELEVFREEHRERWQTHIRHYTEPSTELLLATSSTLQLTMLSLGPGPFCAQHHQRTHHRPPHQSRPN